MFSPIVKGWVSWTELHEKLTLDDVLDLHLVQEALEAAEQKQYRKATESTKKR